MTLINHRPDGYPRTMRIFKALSSVRKGLWFVPVMCVLVGVAISFGTDRH